MDYETILLLLGLAFVLTTGSSLLATSGSGREGNGGNQPSDSNNCFEPGEISGSISITSKGELWLTIFVDTFSILAAIDVVDCDGGEYAYKFSIAGLAELVDKSERSKIQTNSSTHPEIVFSTPEEASERFIELISNLGVELSQEAIRSVPFAINGGWKSPDECKQFIKNVMEAHEEE